MEVEGVVAAFEEVVGADTVGGEGAVLRVVLRAAVERGGIDGGRTVETTDAELVTRQQKTKTAEIETAAARWACLGLVALASFAGGPSNCPGG